MTDDELAALIKRYDDAMMAFYEGMQDIDRRDPRFMATMRKYGLIQKAQAMIETGGAAMSALARAIEEQG